MGLVRTIKEDRRWKRRSYRVGGDTRCCGCGQMHGQSYNIPTRGPANTVKATPSNSERSSQTKVHRFISVSSTHHSRGRRSSSLWWLISASSSRDTERGHHVHDLRDLHPVFLTIDSLPGPIYLLILHLSAYTMVILCLSYARYCIGYGNRVCHRSDVFAASQSLTLSFRSVFRS